MLQSLKERAEQFAEQQPTAEERKKFSNMKANNDDQESAFGVLKQRTTANPTETTETASAHTKVKLNKTFDELAKEKPEEQKRIWTKSRELVETRAKETKKQKEEIREERIEKIGQTIAEKERVMIKKAVIEADLAQVQPARNVEELESMLAGWAEEFRLQILQAQIKYHNSQGVPKSELCISSKGKSLTYQPLKQRLTAWLRARSTAKKSNNKRGRPKTSSKAKPKKKQKHNDNDEDALEIKMR